MLEGSKHTQNGRDGPQSRVHSRKAGSRYPAVWLSAALVEFVQGLPVQQQLDQTALEATMRIRSNPLYGDMARPRASQGCDAQSPLDWLSSMLERKHNVQLDRFEKRKPHVVPPWWTPLAVSINPSAADAIREAETWDW